MDGEPSPRGQCKVQNSHILNFHSESIAFRLEYWTKYLVDQRLSQDALNQDPSLQVPLHPSPTTSTLSHATKSCTKRH